MKMFCSALLVLALSAVAYADGVSHPTAVPLLSTGGEVSLMISRPEFSRVMDEARAYAGKEIVADEWSATIPENGHSVGSLVLFSYVDNHGGCTIGQIQADLTYVTIPHRGLHVVSADNLRFLPQLPNTAGQCFGEKFEGVPSGLPRALGGHGN